MAPEVCNVSFQDGIDGRGHDDKHTMFLSDPLVCSRDGVGKSREVQRRFISEKAFCLNNGFRERPFQNPVAASADGR